MSEREKHNGTNHYRLRFNHIKIGMLATSNCGYLLAFLLSLHLLAMTLEAGLNEGLI